jgi:hypothetical protein
VRDYTHPCVMLRISRKAMSGILKPVSAIFHGSVAQRASKSQCAALSAPLDWNVLTDYRRIVNNERKDRMNQRKSITRMAALVPLVAGFFMASSTVNAADVPDSEQVSKLLSEAKTLAFQLKEDAGTMESFTRSNVTWQSHATAINQIKEHVNALGRQVARLKDARNTASPWQKTAIDRINPFLDELGGYTSAVIEHISGQQKHSADEYRDYLEANADYSADLAAMIADFVDYGKTKQRFERLTAKLEVPSAK